MTIVNIYYLWLVNLPYYLAFLGFFIFFQVSHPPPPAGFCTIKSHIACFCPEPIYTKLPEQRGANYCGHITRLIL